MGSQSLKTVSALLHIEFDCLYTNTRHEVKRFYLSYFPLERNEFRLIELQPGKPSDMLRCSIKHHSLDNPPVYACLLMSSLLKTRDTLYIVMIILSPSGII